MLLPLKAIIRKRSRKDGKSPIYYQYCYNSTNRVLLNTEIAIPPAYWNGKRQFITKSLPEEIGQHEVLNEELTRMRKVIEVLIEHGVASKAVNLGQYVSERFNPTLNLENIEKTTVTIIPITKKIPTFFDQIDDYIKCKDKKVVSTAVFKSMKERLLQFQKHRKRDIMFSILDYNFYSEFVDFLTYDYVLRRKKIPEYGLKLSTIGSTIKNLRVFINDRVRRKIIPPIDLKDFKILDEEADAVYLTYEEIAGIHNLDLTGNAELELSRDLFVLGCCKGSA